MQKSDAPACRFSRSYSLGIKSGSNEISVDLINISDGTKYPIVNAEGYFVDFPGIAHSDVIAPYYKNITIEPIVYYPSRFEITQDGKYIVLWQLQPDGRYWEDSEGFGGTADYEIFLYAYLNEKGKFTAPFRVYRIANVKYFGTDLEEKEQKEYDEKNFAETRRVQEGRSVEDELKILIEKACQIIINALSEEERAGFAYFDVPNRYYEAHITVFGKKPKWRLSVDMKVVHTDKIFSNYIGIGEHDKDWIIEQLKSEEIRQKIFETVEFLRDRLDRD